MIIIIIINYYTKKKKKKKKKFIILFFFLLLNLKDNFDNIVNTSESEREALSIKINQLVIIFINF